MYICIASEVGSYTWNIELVTWAPPDVTFSISLPSYTLCIENETRIYTVTTGNKRLSECCTNILRAVKGYQVAISDLAVDSDFEADADE